MKTFKQILEKSVYDYGNLQVDINKNISDKIKKFADKISKDDIYTKDYGYGIETDHHVTVRYGLGSIDIKELEPIFKGYGESTLRLGKISVFENEETDVLKIEVESDHVKDLNKMTGDNFELPGETRKEYNYHVTIAYMKKGKADKYIGNEEFKNIKNDFNEIVYSSKNGKKYKVKL